MDRENHVKSSIEKDYIETVKKYVHDIQFGTVTLVIQDGKVIQIDRTEKVRI